jgi:hypothetical protein
MILSDIIIRNLLFEDEGELTIGNRCVANIGPSQYLMGVFHSYNTEEYCFKECTYYKDEGKGLIPWNDHAYRPIQWVSRDSLVWAKCTTI